MFAELCDLGLSVQTDALTHHAHRHGDSIALENDGDQAITLKLDELMPRWLKRGV
jgi:hypothetical protein